MNRLLLQRLAGLDREVARPAYVVAAARVGVVHLGVGAFPRAHQAVYLDDRLAAGEARWAIAGASLRSPDTRGPKGEALRGIEQPKLCQFERRDRFLGPVTDALARLIEEGSRRTVAHFAPSVAP